MPPRLLAVVEARVRMLLCRMQVFKVLLRQVRLRPSKKQQPPKEPQEPPKERQIEELVLVLVAPRWHPRPLRRPSLGLVVLGAEP